MYSKPKAVADWWYHGDPYMDSFVPGGLTVHDSGGREPRETGLLWPNGDRIVWTYEQTPMGFDMRGKDEV